MIKCQHNQSISHLKGANQLSLHKFISSGCPSLRSQLLQPILASYKRLPSIQKFPTSHWQDPTALRDAFIPFKLPFRWSLAKKVKHG